LIPDLVEHHSTGRARPALVWRFEHPMLVLSSAPSGGGLGERSWVVNAEVPLDYARVDLGAHCDEIARELGCDGDGVGMLTATDVRRFRVAADNGVRVVATVGLSKPTWAASSDAGHGRWAPGTINLVAWLPVRLSPAALVNAVITATEAKTQALVEAGVPGTGTASDAVCIVCPTDGDEAPFGGPRSVWGSRLARVAHDAVGAGLT
jgi:adenosylcobinamide amidohydrolase